MSDNNEPVAERNSRATLERLLACLYEQPERHEEISADIDRIFAQEKAVLVLDMSGFARTTQQHGIVSFLLMIHQLQSMARSVIEHHKGLLVKAEADNLFCLFDSVTEAIGAAREIVKRLAALNLSLSADRRLYASVGIGYGSILNVGNEDLFGDEVNLASKLGEDVAAPGMVLLTSAARAHLQDAGWVTREETLSVSGLSGSYYVVEGFD